MIRSPHTRILLLIAIASLFAKAQSQTIHRAHGAQLVSVIQQAAPGDIIRFSGVLPLSASPLKIEKALHIHGVRGSQIWRRIEISKIAAGQNLVLQNVKTTWLSIDKCDGHVLLAGLANETFNYFHALSRVRNCRDVVFEDFRGGPFSIENSKVTISRAQFFGTTWNPHSNPFAGCSALKATSSTLYVADSDLRGTGGYMRGHPAIDADSSSKLFLSGSCTLQANGWRTATTPAAAVGSAGSLVYSGQVKFVPYGFAPAIDRRMKSSLRRLPVLQISRASLGGRATVQLREQTGAAYALFVGFPGPWVSIPGVLGETGLRDPLLFDAGIMRTTAKTYMLALPNAARLAGVTFRWQGLTLLGSTFELTQPVTYCHD